MAKIEYVPPEKLEYTVEKIKGITDNKASTTELESTNKRVSSLENELNGVSTILTNIEGKI